MNVLADKDSYKEYLDENRRLLEVVQEGAYNLVEELVQAADQVRIEEVNKLEADLIKRFKLNQIKIKDKIIEVISARPISALENQNLDLLKKKDDREQG